MLQKSLWGFPLSYKLYPVGMGWTDLSPVPGGDFLACIYTYVLNAAETSGCK